MTKDADLNDMSAEAPRRPGGPRIDLRLRARYTYDSVEGTAEASDVSPQGLRLESENAVEAGTTLNLVLDAGDEGDEIRGVGRVTWCRSRPSPGGKPLHDIGVHFSSDWLSSERGPLATALGRLFAMNQYEPARLYERTRVSFQATSGDGDDVIEVADLSMGGMRLKTAQRIGGEGVTQGQSLTVDVAAPDKSLSLVARVAWVEEVGTQGQNFGVQFLEASDDECAYLESMRRGEETPDSIALVLKDD